MEHNGTTLALGIDTGAHVGRWQTIVEAIDMHTVGLEGDSEVNVSDGNGPMRAVPLCVLAHFYPGILNELRRQIELRP